MEKWRGKCFYFLFRVCSMCTVYVYLCRLRVKIYTKIYRLQTVYYSLSIWNKPIWILFYSWPERIIHTWTRAVWIHTHTHRKKRERRSKMAYQNSREKAGQVKTLCKGKDHSNWIGYVCAYEMRSATVVVSIVSTDRVSRFYYITWGVYYS